MCESRASAASCLYISGYGSEMASVANTFSLLDEGPGEASRSRKSKSKNRKKAESASDKLAQPPAAQPEQLYIDEDFEAGFQAVAAKGKARGSDPARGTADARSAAEAAERAVVAADSAADMIRLWRSWTQQVRFRTSCFSDLI